MTTERPSLHEGQRPNALLAGLLLLVGALIPQMAAAAPAASTAMTVSATIAKRASLQVIEQPASVLVTQADVARGYIEVVSPVQVSVRSNSPSGYLLVIESLGDFVAGGTVRGMGFDVQLDGSGVVSRPACGPGGAIHSLAIRLRLSASARPGTHPWPVHMSAMPI